MKSARGEVGKETRPLYARIDYAEAFGGQVLDVPEWQTAVLRRPIPASEWEDALGPYPLCLMGGKADLEAGLERMRAAGLVSVALVTDPVTGPSPAHLSAAFALCRPFKRHYLIDRSLGQDRLPASHRRGRRKALRECEVNALPLQSSLGDWERLYRGIIGRHRIAGLQKFSPEYFETLAGMPEVEAFAATLGGEIVSMALWVRSPEVVYYHLGASDTRGYEAQAMYGIFAAALEHFASAPVIHLGGAAGISSDEEDGLARFKRGFANHEAEAYFCGASLYPERYAALVGAGASDAFFPAYRQP